MRIMHKVGRTISDIIEIIAAEVTGSRNGDCSWRTTAKYVWWALAEVYVAKTHCTPRETRIDIAALEERFRIEWITRPFTADDLDIVNPMLADSPLVEAVRAWARTPRNSSAEDEATSVLLDALNDYNAIAYNTPKARWEASDEVALANEPLVLDSAGPFTAWYEGDNAAALRAVELTRIHSLVASAKRG
jgi:hypothetical protein